VFTVLHPSGVRRCRLSVYNKFVARVLESSRMIKLGFEACHSSIHCLLDSFLFSRLRSSHYWEILSTGCLAVKDRENSERIRLDYHITGAQLQIQYTTSINGL
jgi:hypothetical protein